MSVDDLLTGECCSVEQSDGWFVVVASVNGKLCEFRAHADEDVVTVFVYQGSKLVELPDIDGVADYRAVCVVHVMTAEGLFE